MWAWQDELLCIQCKTSGFLLKVSSFWFLVIGPPKAENSKIIRVNSRVLCPFKVKGDIDQSNKHGKKKSLKCGHGQLMLIQFENVPEHY